MSASQVPTPDPKVNVGVLADHIAAEAIRRMIAGQSLGQPSLHNFIREAAIDLLDKEFGS